MAEQIVHVEVSYGEGRTENLIFDKNSIMIGRATGNDVSLESVNGVSRYHARLSVDSGKLFIEDLESTNGTFLNSERVATAELALGDAISIGEAVIRVELKEQEPEKAPAPPPEPTPAPRVAEAPAAAPEEKKDSPTDSGVKRSDEFYWRSLQSFLSPVWEYIVDDAVSEILINGPQEIFIEKKGRLQQVNVVYNNDQLQAAVLNIAQYMGRRVSEEEPYLDARLPDGSRVAILMPPCSRKGISISIRKFAKEKLTLDKLIEFGSLTPDMVMYLRAAVLLKKNIIVSGGTSSGKTSLLNVVTSLIPDDERILTIEDSAELQLTQSHVLPMETKPPDKKGRGQITIRDLVKASLRMRPDRIIVGEIRSGEALDLLQAMNTGHSGSMATVHASSPRQALTRMETLALFSGIEIPMRALREQVSSAIEVVIQASRLPDHSRKVVYISEVNKLTESGEYQVTDIFRYQRESMKDGKILGQHKWTGNQTVMFEEMDLAGLTDAVTFFSKAEKKSAA